MNFLNEAKEIAGDVCGEGNEIVAAIPAEKIVSKTPVNIENLAGMNDEATKACPACQGNDKEAHTCIG